MLFAYFRILKKHILSRNRQTPLRDSLTHPKHMHSSTPFLSLIMQSALKPYLVKADNSVSSKRLDSAPSRKPATSYGSGLPMPVATVHSRGHSVRESSEERKGPSARVGGVLATYGQFLKGMTRERRQLEKSLLEKRQECEKLK
jgi:hypothetical protein